MFDNAGQLAQIIDLTLVKPDATLEDLTRSCGQAKQYGFAAMIVSGFHVARAKAALSGTAVKVGAVVGFPQGICTTTVKIVEAMEAMKNGAEELDIMMNLGLVKSGRLDLAEIDVKNTIVMTKGVVHKVILETGLLTNDEITALCRIAAGAGAEYIKTCTGFGPRGATAEDVRIIREAVGSTCRIKASGGIRDLATLTALVEAGAERIGTSVGSLIMEEYLSRRKG